MDLVGTPPVTSYLFSGLSASQKKEFSDIFLETERFIRLEGTTLILLEKFEPITCGI
jgi:hypothetical protein